MLTGIWYATEWTAAALGYQIRRGALWFVFHHVPVYHPWRLFEWWSAYEPYAPEVFTTGGTIAAGSGVLAAVAAIVGTVWRARQSKLVTTYGSARWMTDRDNRRAGLARPASSSGGRVSRHYLRHDGPAHVMAFAPTRSGKGVGLVVPTRLTWPDSAA